MKKSTFTKTCLSVLAFLLCTSFASAANDQSTNAAVQYQLTLLDYIKITSTGNKDAQTTFGQDYGSISIQEGMTGHFDIISNDPTRQMNLKASCPLATGGVESPLYDVTFTGDNGTGKLIFTRTENSPSDASLTNIKGTPAADSNPNAIAFNITFAKTYAHGLDDGGLTPTFDSEKGAIEFDMTNGVATLEVQVNGSNVENTFNTKDQSGTYQATLTLTDGAL